MKFLSFRHVLIGLCMIAGAGLAVAMKPSEKLADQAQFDLETLVPKQFGDWRLDTTVVTGKFGS